MKKIILLALATIIAASCDSSWEYKIVTYQNSETGVFSTPSLNVKIEELNTLGFQGWELVSTYTVVETVNPNFGSEEVVWGIRDNTRTKSINYVFKRKKK